MAGDSISKKLSDEVKQNSKKELSQKRAKNRHVTTWDREKKLTTNDQNDSHNDNSVQQQTEKWYNKKWDAYDDKIIKEIPDRSFSPKAAIYNIKKRIGFSSAIEQRLERIDGYFKEATEYIDKNIQYLSDTVKKKYEANKIIANTYKEAAEETDKNEASYRKRSEGAKHYKSTAQQFMGMADQLREWKIKTLLPEAKNYLNSCNNLFNHEINVLSVLKNDQPDTDAYEQSAEKIIWYAERRKKRELMNDEINSIYKDIIKDSSKIKDLEPHWGKQHEKNTSAAVEKYGNTYKEFKYELNVTGNKDLYTLYNEYKPKFIEIRDELLFKAKLIKDGFYEIYEDIVKYRNKIEILKTDKQALLQWYKQYEENIDTALKDFENTYTKFKDELKSKDPDTLYPDTLYNEYKSKFIEIKNKLLFKEINTKGINDNEIDKSPVRNKLLFRSYVALNNFNKEIDEIKDIDANVKERVIEQLTNLRDYRARNLWAYRHRPKSETSEKTKIREEKLEMAKDDITSFSKGLEENKPERLYRGSQTDQLPLDRRYSVIDLQFQLFKSQIEDAMANQHKPNTKRLFEYRKDNAEKYRETVKKSIGNNEKIDGLKEQEISQFQIAVDEVRRLRDKLIFWEKRNELAQEEFKNVIASYEIDEDTRLNTSTDVEEEKLRKAFAARDLVGDMSVSEDNKMTREIASSQFEDAIAALEEEIQHNNQEENDGTVVADTNHNSSTGEAVIQLERPRLEETYGNQEGEKFRIIYNTIINENNKEVRTPEYINEEGKKFRMVSEAIKNIAEEKLYINTNTIENKDNEKIQTSIFINENGEKIENPKFINGNGETFSINYRSIVDKENKKRQIPVFIKENDGQEFPILLLGKRSELIGIVKMVPIAEKEDTQS